MTAKETASLIVFDFGDKVEFDIRQGKDVGIVCEVLLSPGQVQYTVIWSDKRTSKHFDFEIKKTSHL